MKGDTLNISADTYASTFPACKPGERVTGTYEGVVGEPAGDGSYPIQVTAVTKETAGEAEPLAAEVSAVDKSMSPAAQAVMGKK